MKTEMYEKMNNSIRKNIQELAEFCVDYLNVTNYYDLVDKIMELNGDESDINCNDIKLTMVNLEDIMK